MRYDFLIINSVVAIALLILGLVAFINNRKQLMNRLFLLFTICIGVWLVAAAISNDTHNSPTVSLFGNYAVFSFSYLTSYLLVWFTALVANNKKATVLLRQLIVPVIIITGLSASPLVVSGVELQGDVYGVDFGPLIILYAIALVTQLGASMVILARGLRKSTGRSRDQIAIMLVSLGLAIPILLVTQFILPAITGSFAITDIGIMAMILPVVGLYVSVIRHGLFDIKLVAVRSSAYALSLIVLGGIYYLLAYGISVFLFREHTTTSMSLSPINIVLALVLAFVFQPVRVFFDRITNRIFYRDRYDVEEFIALLSNTLSSTTDLKDMLARASEIIQMTLKTRHAFFVLNNGSGRELIGGVEHHGTITLHELARIEPLVNRQKSGVIVADMIVRHRTAFAVMSRHGIEILLALRHENSIIGYLAIGEALGPRYTNRDYKTLEAVADELVIAIQNAMSVEEVREVNENLQDRIDHATRVLRSKNERLRQLDDTKDEFISMASHQLRTPLTSVKGYGSMILDGDAGPINPQQRQFLTEAFDSSNRMAGIIGDFLNVSRLQTGKFSLEREDIDLSEVVESEVEHLQNTANTRGLKLLYRRPAHFPKMSLDKSKIEQVVMNFIDNAIFYAPNTGAVDIELFQRAGRAVFTVRDHGIGVPKSEQAELFGKFFRATNARRKRPDGTGVGLFLAKKVIVAHKGTVIFESEEGKGSVFGFEIPLKPED